MKVKPMKKIVNFNNLRLLIQGHKPMNPLTKIDPASMSPPISPGTVAALEAITDVNGLVQIIRQQPGNDVLATRVLAKKLGLKQDIV